jgi:hypothetical protein
MRQGNRFRQFQDIPAFPNEVSDATVFAKLIEAGTGKYRIPPEPEFLEPRSVTIDKRRDSIQDAIGCMRVSGF